jgi:hypothetical protein
MDRFSQHSVGNASQKFWCRGFHTVPSRKQSLPVETFRDWPCSAPPPQDAIILQSAFTPCPNPFTLMHCDSVIPQFRTFCCVCFSTAALVRPDLGHGTAHTKVLQITGLGFQWFRARQQVLVAAHSVSTVTPSKWYGNIMSDLRFSRRWL